MDEGGFFAAYKGACSVSQVNVEVETTAKNIFAQQSVFPGLIYGFFEPIDGQRILGTYVYQAV